MNIPDDDSLNNYRNDRRVIAFKLLSCVRFLCSFEAITTLHQTTIYGRRTDSKSKVLNESLQQICEMIDPKKYPSAHGVIVDIARFPSIYSQRESYRKKDQSQSWVFYSEESPRNPYRSVKMKSSV